MDVAAVINIIFDLIWTIIRFNYEVICAVCRTILPPEPKDVKDDIVLITGAGHGMGREMALRFARLGAILVCVDINASTNEDTAAKIRQEKGRAHAFVCNVTDRSAVMQLKEKVCREVGDVAILVNNAGIMPAKPLLEQTENEIRLQNDININGNLWMIQAFLPNMIQRNYGHIVAMSSMAGLMGFRNLVPYCATKYGVKGIMDALANELREDPRELDGIKLTTIYPYIINTGLCKKPRIRFENLMKVIDAGVAANIIIDAVRRNYMEATVPPEFLFVNKFLFRLMPFRAACVWTDFFSTGVEAHD